MFFHNEVVLHLLVALVFNRFYVSIANYDESLSPAMYHGAQGTQHYVHNPKANTASAIHEELRSVVAV